MTPKELIEYAGGTHEQAAIMIGVTRGAISQWAKQGAIPLSRQPQIELLTHGKLKADMVDPREIAVERLRKRAKAMGYDLVPAA